QYRQEIEPLRGKLVFLAQRAFAVGPANEQLVFREGLEPARERVRRDPEAPLKILKPAHAHERRSQDEHAPPIARLVERTRDGALHRTKALVTNHAPVDTGVTIVMQVI